MGFRIGVDLVEAQGVAEALAAFGERYLRRVYTAAEVTESSWQGEVVSVRLAARFAAKEAALKVLRPIDSPIAWTDIEVRRGAGSAPRMRLAGSAARLAAAQGLTCFAVSLTHDGGFASAVVLAEEGERRDDG